MADRKTGADSMHRQLGRSADGRRPASHHAGDRFEVESAGTKPSQVRPEAIAVMKELGIDISGHRSKSVDEFAGRKFDYVLTVCDNAKESCPIFPGTQTGFIGNSKIRPQPEDRRTSVWRSFGACAISFATICATFRRPAESICARIAPGSNGSIGSRRQSFQNAAIADKAFSRTPALDLAQLGRKPSQVGDFPLNFLQVVRSNSIDRGTLLLGLSGQAQKIADLVKREPKSPASVNEPQPVQVFLLVGAVISLRARRRRHEFDLLVIPDGHDLDPGLFREIADAHIPVQIHALDPIVTIGLILKR